MEQEQDGETIFSVTAANEEIGSTVASEATAITESLVEFIDSGWVKTATQDEINKRVAEIAEPYSEAAKGLALAGCRLEDFALRDVGDGKEDLEIARFYRSFATALEQLVEPDSAHPEVIDWEHPPGYFDDIVDQIRSGKRQWRRFRTILAAFGYSRRRKTAIDKINRELMNKGLKTKPDITADLPLNASVVFSLLEPTVSLVDEDVEFDDLDELGEEREDLETVTEISITVGDLKASERQPEWLSPDATVEEAMTLMDLYDYSQIVVRTGLRSVKGFVSYRSIARAQRDGEIEYVRECIDVDVQRAYTTDSLLDVVAIFHNHDAVVVFNQDGTLSGLVTPADIAEEFGGMAEPFFLIGEIETLLRWLVKRRELDVNSLLMATHGESVVPASVDRLTLGDLEHMLQSEEGWKQIDVPYDRKVFCRVLEDVRESRNELMHFRGDLTAKQVEQIRQFLSLLRGMCEGVEKEMGGTP